MNDRLKFRAWHKPTKQLFEVLCFTPSLVFENMVDGIYKIEDCVLEQCTGLRDMCGRLIYEGDVLVDLHNSLFYVSYCDETGSLMLFDIEDRVAVLHFYAPFNLIRVIGNIHEHVPKFFWEDKQ